MLRLTSGFLGTWAAVSSTTGVSETDDGTQGNELAVLEPSPKAFVSILIAGTAFLASLIVVYSTRLGWIVGL